MKIFVGTSGYSYKEWKGTFYPDDLSAAKMLPYYGERFDTVEINNTFYRMPDEKTVERWGEQVPDGFRFAIKAPQRITHQKKLVAASEDVARLVEVAGSLGAKLGPLLFQLPPYLRKDSLKLREFLAIVPDGHEVAFEFRHASWFDEEIASILRQRDCALCFADTDEVADPQSLVNATATWGYLRLRRTEYATGELAAWAARVLAQKWERAYVFFKHEDEGKGPKFALEFLRELAAQQLQPGG